LVLVVFSSLLLLLVDPVAEVLRKVFRSGLANWSAAPNVSSPSLLPAELLVDEDIESAETLARGRGLGFDNGAVEAGRSRTKSGVCFCFCWIEVRWLQKSRLERNPPRRLPMLSVAEAVEATVDPAAPGPVVLFSHIDLFLLNPPALASPCPDALTCSLDAQLDCLSMTGGALLAVDTSAIDDRGAGSGGLENFRGLAPPLAEKPGNVLLTLICSAVFLLTIGWGACRSA